MGLTIDQLEARRTPGKYILIRDAKPGLRVRVSSCSGIDSGKVGTIMRVPLDITEGWYGGQYCNWQRGKGTYAHQVAVLLDNEMFIGMFIAHLQYV